MQSGTGNPNPNPSPNPNPNPNQVGFTDVQGGTGNAVYQLAAALVGTLLGG